MTFRGDAHKFFLKLKKNKSLGRDVLELNEMKEVTNIMSVYEKFSTPTLRKINIYIQKEFNGGGSIPLLVTTVPWLFFIFSGPLMDWLFSIKYVWIIFALLYASLLVSGIILHFRERAWAKTHLLIIDDILSNRNETIPHNYD